MKGEFAFLAWLAGRIFVVTLIIGAAVFLLGWLAGWRTALEFSNAFFIVGGSFIVLGTLTVMGGFKLRGDYLINFAQSAGVLTGSERTRQNVDNAQSIYSNLLLVSISGLFLILISIGIDKIL